MTWPTKTDFVDGDVLTATQVNNIGTNLNLFDPTSATSGQVPVADGSGSVAWGSAGGISQIATASITSGSSYSFTSIPQTYKHLILNLDNLDVTNACQINVNINGDGVFANRSIIRTDISNNFVSTGSYSTTAGVLLTDPAFNFSATTYTNSFVINIPFYTVAQHRIANAQGSYIGTSRATITSFYAGNYSNNGGAASGADSAAVTSLKIILSAGTFTAGTATLYGVS